MCNFGIAIILLTNKQLLLIASLVSLRRDVHRTIPAIIEQVKVRIVLYGKNKFRDSRTLGSWYQGNALYAFMMNLVYDK